MKAGNVPIPPVGHHCHPLKSLDVFDPAAPCEHARLKPTAQRLREGKKPPPLPKKRLTKCLI